MQKWASDPVRRRHGCGAPCFVSTGAWQGLEEIALSHVREWFENGTRVVRERESSRKVVTHGAALRAVAAAATGGPDTPRSPVPGTWYLEPGIWHLISGIWYLGSGIWYLVPGTWYLVSGTWYLAPGIWYLVSRIWYRWAIS